MGAFLTAKSIAAKSMIAEKQRTATEHRHHDIHPAVIIEVAESGPAASHGSVRSTTDTFKAAATIQREHRRLRGMKGGIDLFDVIHDVALRYE